MMFVNLKQVIVQIVSRSVMFMKDVTIAFTYLSLLCISSTSNG